MHEYSAAVLRTGIYSDKEVVFVVVIVLTCSVTDDVVDLTLVAQEATDAAKSFAELEALGTLVGNELDFHAEISVMHEEPVGESHGRDYFQVDAGLGVFHVLGVLLLGVAQELDSSIASGWVLEVVSGVGNVLPQDEGGDGSHSHGLDGVVHSELDHASVQSDLVVELTEQLLLLDELHVGEDVSSESDSLVEALLLAIGHVVDSEDDALQTFI